MENTTLQEPRKRANGPLEGGRDSAKFYRSGALKRTPRDLMRGGRQLLAQAGWNIGGPHGTIAGPLTVIEGVEFHAGNTPHRCTECGGRDHAGIACTVPQA